MLFDEESKLIKAKMECGAEVEVDLSDIRGLKYGIVAMRVKGTMINLERKEDKKKSPLQSWLKDERENVRDPSYVIPFWIGNLDTLSALIRLVKREAKKASKKNGFEGL